MIGIDTSALIDFFKGDETIKKILEDIQEPLVLTQLNYLELIFGIKKDNKKHHEEEKQIDALFSELIILNLTTEASKKASRIYHKLKKEGKEIGQFDCIQMGILQHNGIHKIITKDKHFLRVPEMKCLFY